MIFYINYVYLVLFLISNNKIIYYFSIIFKSLLLDFDKLFILYFISNAVEELTVYTIFGGDKLFFVIEPLSGEEFLNRN